MYALQLREFIRHNPRFFLLLAGACTLLLFALIAGCREQPAAPVVPVPGGSAGIASDGEEFLTAAADELLAIAEWADPGLTRRNGAFRKVDADSVYVYGEVTPEGYGAVVTERHGYPKGILLITVRKSYGRDGRVVSETKRYISEETFAAGLPQQSIITEVVPMTGDTILTHVMRNGNVETYTFRMPVITRTTNQLDGTIRITSRFASGGAVVSEIRDEGGTLIRRASTTTLASGAIQTRTEYADGSWRTVSTLGRGDGTILREITTGQ